MSSLLYFLYKNTYLLQTPKSTEYTKENFIDLLILLFVMTIKSSAQGGGVSRDLNPFTLN